MSIDEAKEEFDFFNEGDYITRGMSIAKDVVLQELENTKADLYEANNCISDLLDVAKEREKMIDEMAKYIDDFQMECNKYYKDKEDVIKTFEKRCKDAKN